MHLPNVDLYILNFTAYSKIQLQWDPSSIQVKGFWFQWGYDFTHSAVVIY